MADVQALLNRVKQLESENELLRTQVKCYSLSHNYLFCSFSFLFLFFIFSLSLCIECVA